MSFNPLKVRQGADGYLAFFTDAGGIAGDNDLFWDRANNRLGVGVSAPTAKLHVNQDIEELGLLVTGGAIGTSIARFQRDVASDGFVDIKSGGGDVMVTFDAEGGQTPWSIGYDESTDHFVFSFADTIAGNPLVYIDSSGQVGIGDNNPSFALDVSGSGAFSSSLGIATTTLTNTLNVDGNANIGFDGSAAPTNGLIVEGQVGIGTDSPDTDIPLQVVGSFGRVIIQNNQSSNTNKSARIGTGHFSTSENPVNGMMIIGNEGDNRINIGGGTSLYNAANRIIFYTAPTATSGLGSAAMMINLEGHLGLGTFKPHEKLTINGIISLEEQDDYDRTHDGYGSLWAKSDGKLYFTNDAGTEYDLTAAGGGGGVSATEGADGYLAFFTGSDSIAGDNDLFWDRANNRLGIGTITPANQLHIRADIDNHTTLKVENATNADGAEARLEVINNNGGARLALYSQSSTQLWGTISLADTFRITSGNVISGGVLLGSDGASPVRIGTNSVERIYIESTGEVGIGTTTPQNILDVAGGMVVGSTSAGSATAPTNGMLIDGNVSIGSIDDTKLLHVFANNADAEQVRFRNASTADGASIVHDMRTDHAAMSWRVYGSGNTGTVFGYDAAGLAYFRTPSGTSSNVSRLLMGTGGQQPINFIVDDITRITLSSLGHLGIGTELPIEPLTINGPIALQELGSTPATEDGYGKIWVDSSGELNFVDDNGNNVQITDTGSVNAAGGGGITATEGADGYLAFFTGSDSIAGDNDLFWHRGNNSLGIGTTNPGRPLEVRKDYDGNAGIQSYNQDAGTSAHASFTARAINAGSTDGSRLYVVAFGENYNQFTIDGEALASAVWIAADAFTSKMLLGCDTSSPVHIYTGGTIGLTVDANQDIIMGAASAGARLTVDDTVTDGAVVQLRANGSNLLSFGRNSSPQAGVIATQNGIDLYLEPSSGSVILNRSSGDPDLQFAIGDTVKFSMGVDDSDSDKFKIGTTAITTNNAITIDSSGQVGIGTSSPSAPLMSNRSSEGVGFRMAVGGSSMLDITSASSPLRTSIQTLNTRHLILNSASGYVGIGTAITTPAYVLHIKEDQDAETNICIENASTGSSSRAKMQFSAGGSVRASIDTAGQDGRFNLVNFTDDTSGAIKFYTNYNSSFIIPLHISNQGNIGIMTVQPHERLTVNGRIALQAGAAPGAAHDADGYGTLYVDSSDNDLYYQYYNESAVNLTTGGGGGGDVSQTSGFTGADGYIAFWTGDGELAGDNDLYWSRETNTLQVKKAGVGQFINSANFTNSGQLLVEDSVGGATTVLALRNRTSVTDRPVSMDFQSLNSIDAPTTYSRIESNNTVSTSGSEDGELIFYTSINGSLTEGMRIDDAGVVTISGNGLVSNGDVGIGVSSPDTILHLQGSAPTLTIRDSSETTGTTLDSADFGVDLIREGHTSISGQFLGALKFYSTDPNFTTENPKLLAGIGAYVDQAFTADNDAGTHLRFFTSSTDGGTSNVLEERLRIYDTSAPKMSFGDTHSSDPTLTALFRESRDGDVGIEIYNGTSSGSTNASQMLRIDGQSGADLDIICYGQGKTGSVAGLSLGSSTWLTSTTAYMALNTETSAGEIFLCTNNTVALTVDTDQTVGIGTQNPNEILTLEGALSLDEISAPSNTAGYGKIYVGTDSELHFIDDSGNDTQITTAPSDIRLKQNIRPIENALSSILSMNGVKYEWNDTAHDYSNRPLNKTELGLIAQDVEKVMPELVSNGTTYKKMDYERLTAVLVEAIKELTEEVNILKKKINEQDKDPE